MRTLLQVLSFLVGITTGNCYANVEPFYSGYYGKLLGAFQRQGSSTSTHHDVSGTVYVVDENHIIIIGFEYDGLAPDAFIWAGSSAQPDTSGDIIHIDTFDSPRPLGMYDGSKPLLLTLPTDNIITDYTWISIWCRTAQANFAELDVPGDFQIPAAQNIGVIDTDVTTTTGVTILNNKQIRLEGLDYSGNCQNSTDTYWVGKGSSPSASGKQIFSTDDSGVNRISVTPSATTQDVILTLSKPDTTSDIGYIGIWCRKGSQNQGHVALGSSLNVPPFIEDHYYGEYIGNFAAQGSVSDGDRALGSVYVATATVVLIVDFTLDPGQTVVHIRGVTDSASDACTGGILSVDGSTDALTTEYDHERVVVDLPPDNTIADYNSIAVWDSTNQKCLGRVDVVSNIVVPTIKDIGTLREYPNLVHKVLVDNVRIINHQTFLLQNIDYDGYGPDAYMWPITHDLVGWRASWQLQGGTIMSLQKIPTVGPGWTDQNVYVHLPDWMTVFDIDKLTIWCVLASQRFGTIDIESEDLTNIPPNFDRLSSDTGSGYTFQDQCEVLSNDELQVHWLIDDTADTIDITLEGKVELGTYMSFGISGSNTGTVMIGSDVAVAWIDETQNGMVKDYHITSKQQCTNGQGACPDSESTVSSGMENLQLTSSSFNNGVASIVYRRSLDTGDANADKVISSDSSSSMYIVWAIGPVNSDGYATYHSSRISGTKQIVFGRAGTTSCTSLAGGTDPNIEPWDAVEIIAGDQITTFRADIGIAGGARGYEGITGIVGWGIAWYLNDELIPELTLTRGVTYTFEVYGGDDSSATASYHPFYITNDPAGGFSQVEDTQNHVIYADPEVGTLCEWQVTGSEPATNYDTFAEFRDANLERVCTASSPQQGTLQWTPDANTPALVYYQCYTHRYLGWKINIVDDPLPTWSDWTGYGECSFTCGDGTQTRTRTCSDPDDSDDVVCGDDTTMSQTCNQGACPVTWTDWTGYGECSFTCGSGMQTRTRTCSDPDDSDDVVCSDDTTMSQNCNEGACPVSWSDWTGYGECSLTCGDGTQTRTRTCSDPDDSDDVVCSDDTTMSQNCNEGACPVTWTDWTGYGECSVTCGSGTQTRTRTCSDPDDSDAVVCSDDTTMSQNCNPGACPVPTWNEWGSYGGCTVTCGGGLRTRTRTCSDPDSADSVTCVGDNTGLQICNMDSCPEPTWSIWGSYDACTVTCGGGTQTRTRMCNDPDITDNVDCGAENMIPVNMVVLARYWLHSGS